MRTILIAACVVLAASSAACGPSPASDAADDSTRHPSWLLGTWSYTSPAGDRPYGSHHILEADGRAKHHSFTGSNLAYGVGDRRETKFERWSATATTLDIGGIPWRLLASPNCRLLQLGSLTYAHDDGEHPGCPFAVAPLSELESAVVGKWRFYGPDEDEWAFNVLSIGADRDVWMTFDPHAAQDESSDSVHAYYSVDENSVLHGTQPDGEEILTLQLELDGGTWLKICARRCVFMKRTGE